MAKLSNGLVSAVPRFLIIGILFPFTLDYFYLEVSRFIALPPSFDRWITFVIFGSLFALVGFLQNAYKKGDYPWLFGKVGGGVVSLVFYSYLFLLLPRVSGSQSIQVAGLLPLIYVAIGLSYLHLILDFFEARISRPIVKPEERP